MDMTTVKLTDVEALVLDWTIRDAITAAREAVAHAICDLHDAEAYRLAAARRDALITASIALADGIAAAQAQSEPQHTVRGQTSEDGWPYGTTHDMDCPACVASGSSFTSSPRSETYWSS